MQPSNICTGAAASNADLQNEKEMQCMMSDQILFVSDYVCPYCLVAKEALKRALHSLGRDAEITWHPFELTREPAPRVDTYHDETRRAHYQVLTEPCRIMGLDMKLPPHIVPRPYTRMAFEGYYFAAEHGCANAYNDLVYRAYFIEEEDIGDLEVLCRLAEKAGLDKELFRSALKERRYQKNLDEANRYAREELHVSHVPTIYMNGQELTPEDYSPEAFLRALEDASLSESAADDTPEDGCGPHGCSF